MTQRTNPEGTTARRVGLLSTGLVLLGLAVRLWPFAEGETLAYPVDYDEGVYFSAAALLYRGTIPYRDFVFVHPPGVLWLLGVTAVWRADPALLFAASRWIAAVLGAASVFLAWRVARREGGVVAGGVAGLLYALYPEAVSAERGPFLEPALNLLCLALALTWLGRGDNPRRYLGAGLLAGAALSVKVWAGAWVLATLASLPPAARRDALPRLALGVAIALAVLVGPLALLAPGDFLTQTLLFHTWRPPDGAAGMDRVRDIVHIGHRAATLLALVGLLASGPRLLRPDARAARFFGVVWLLTMGGFLLSSSYWRQYNAHLAASEAVLAGLGAGALWNALAGRLRPLRVVGLVGLALGLQRPWKEVRSRALQRSREQVELAAVIRERVSPGACLLALEPAWALLGGRLPSAPPGAPLLVDSYGALLLSATSGGARYPDIYAAFSTDRAQAPVRPFLGGCAHLATGWRGTWQLSPASREAIAARYELVSPPPGGEGIQLWARRE